MNPPTGKPAVLCHNGRHWWSGEDRKPGKKWPYVGQPCTCRQETWTKTHGSVS